jgi:hypothetical protein
MDDHGDANERVAREDRLFAPYDAQQVDRFDLIGP